jgi:TatD DNase family protein
MDNKNTLIDTHCHLDDPRFDADLQGVIERAKEAGIEAVISVGCWRGGDFDKLIAIVNGHDFVFGALGIHPHDAGKVADNDDAPFELIKKLAVRNKKIVAIGETGLDYHYKNSTPDDQRRVFKRLIALARELNLPLIVHSREANLETMEILEREGARETGGVLHCFSGTAEMAQKALELGFYLSISGTATFDRADALRDVIKNHAPMERLLIETDAPYLAPVPMRGKRNEPAFVAHTAAMLASIKGLSVEDVGRITTLNARELFALPGRDIGKDKAKIAYAIRDCLYLNVTNRCTNYCTFCAKFKSYTVKGHYLRLSEEPTAAEVLKAVGPDPAEKYKEVVFCGYGEPLIRLDLVKEVGKKLKKMGCRIRIDTDGLANLAHKRNVLPELQFVDVISVSLNAPDSETYRRIINTPYGDDAYPAILFFLKEAKKHIAKVVATAVSVPGVDMEACRRVAEDEIGVKFRVRTYNEVG